MAKRRKSGGGRKKAAGFFLAGYRIRCKLVRTKHKKKK